MSSGERSNRVYVLGAGFTKAFFPDAPLLVDDYDVERLMKDFSPFPAASAALALEQRRTGEGKINLERLMSRLDGGMPHDGEGIQDEFRLLLAALRARLVRRITVA